MLRRLSPVLLCLALATACGGGDDGGSGSDGLPKAEFIRAAEAICKDANVELEAEPEPTAAAGVGPYFDTLVGIADTTTSELEELAADQPDKEEVDRIFLTPLRGQVSAIQDYLPKAKEALAQGEEAFTNLPEPTLPEADIPGMKAYGFETCVETATSGE